MINFYCDCPCYMHRLTGLPPGLMRRTVWQYLPLRRQPPSWHDHPFDQPSRALVVVDSIPIEMMSKTNNWNYVKSSNFLNSLANDLISRKNYRFIWISMSDPGCTHILKCYFKSNNDNYHVVNYFIIKVYKSNNIKSTCSYVRSDRKSKTLLIRNFLFVINDV